jgi:hypothetical protein
MASAAERALGKLLSKHRTDNRRRGRMAVRELLLGGLVTAAAVIAFLAGLPLAAAAPVLVLGVLELWRGAARALDHRRLGAELYAVRERGFIHRRAGKARAVRWEQLTSVRPVGSGGRALLRLFGRDVTCVIRLDDGESLRLTRFTHDADGLAEALAARAGTRDGARDLTPA